MNQDSSGLIETRVEVGLKGSNVLRQMNKLVIECPNIDESYRNSHTQKCNMRTQFGKVNHLELKSPAVVIATWLTVWP